MNCSPLEAEQRKKKNALSHYSPKYNPLAEFPGADSYALYRSSRPANSAPATLRSTVSSDSPLIDAKPAPPLSKSLSSTPVVLTESGVSTALMEDNFEGVHSFSTESEMVTDTPEYNRGNDPNDNKLDEEEVKWTFQSSSAPLTHGTFNSFQPGWSREIQEVRDRITEGRAELETYTLMYQQRQENLGRALEEFGRLSKEMVTLEGRIGSEYVKAKGAVASLEGGECCLTRETRAGSLMNTTTVITTSAARPDSLSFSNSTFRLAMSALTAASSHDKSLPSPRLCSLCQKSDSLAEKRGQLRKLDKELDLAQRNVHKCTSYLNHAKRTYLNPIIDHLVKDQSILAQLLKGSKRHSEGDLLIGFTSVSSKQVLGH